jgi:uncharacterized protein
MNDFVIAKGARPIVMHGRYANRHGLTAGATGTGKTVSLMVLAEGFSRLGVPVFVVDVKGDIAGLSMPGGGGDAVRQRAEAVGLADYAQEGNPVVLWDVFGSAGHPLRTTVSELGPTLLARVLGVNDTQAAVLDIAFAAADDRGLLLLDLADLRALLTFVAGNRAEVSAKYGLVAGPSIAALQRAVLKLEREGGAQFFGEPALEIEDLLRTDVSGRGLVHVLAADRLLPKPALYSSVLLWLLSELFEQLPEAGDLDRPRLVLMFDEAHLLFEDATPALQEKIEQVVRLIRSKGVGVYFCSQYPDDLPPAILGQLGNRIQHALRAYTPRDQKALRAAAETFVLNPAIDTAAAIAELGVGEALISLLEEDGVPAPVERALMAPPRARIGTLTADERAAVRARSPFGTKYDQTLDRESAHEVLGRQAAPDPKAGDKEGSAQRGALEDLLWGRGRREGLVEAAARQAARSIGGELGRQILRGALGSITGRTRRR